jgi:hypothetical protein
MEDHVQPQLYNIWHNSHQHEIILEKREGRKDPKMMASEPSIISSSTTHTQIVSLSNMYVDNTVDFNPIQIVSSFFETSRRERYEQEHISSPTPHLLDHYGVAWLSRRDFYIPRGKESLSLF